MKMTVKEKAFRERAARYGFKVKRRGKVFMLRGPDGGVHCTTMKAHEAMLDMHEAAMRRDSDRLFNELIGFDLF
jgi:hypothetical protein